MFKKKIDKVHSIIPVLNQAQDYNNTSMGKNIAWQTHWRKNNVQEQFTKSDRRLPQYKHVQEHKLTNTFKK